MKERNIVSCHSISENKSKRRLNTIGVFITLWQFWEKRIDPIYLATHFIKNYHLHLAHIAAKLRIICLICGYSNIFSRWNDLVQLCAVCFGLCACFCCIHFLAPFCSYLKLLRHCLFWTLQRKVHHTSFMLLSGANIVL